MYLRFPFNGTTLNGCCIFCNNRVRRFSSVGKQSSYEQLIRKSAITDDEKTFNKLSVVWNVLPVLVEGESVPDATIEKGIELLKADGILETGDVVVLSGGAQTVINKNCTQKVMGGVLKI